jgi:hypothetical protein
MVTRAYQFKFGGKWQYDYRPGDALRWGGNDEGDPGEPLVFAECTPEPCPRCGDDIDSDAFRLRIEHDRLISVDGPFLLNELIFGSSLGAPATREALARMRAELGLWRHWSGMKTYSNFGEYFRVLENRPLTRLYPRFADLSWAGPAFVDVLGTKRTERLIQLLTPLPLTLLYSQRGGEAADRRTGGTGD